MKALVPDLRESARPAEVHDLRSQSFQIKTISIQSVFNNVLFENAEVGSDDRIAFKAMVNPTIENMSKFYKKYNKLKIEIEKKTGIRN